jgi:TRAP-type C4-dicarboxylate transport system permease small subunit
VIELARVALSRLNHLLAAAAMIALVAACAVLTWSVTSRAAFASASDWEDETAVFLLVGAIFLTAAYVQEGRGHIGIEALAEALPPSWNAVRRRCADAASLAFCGFFAWKSWTLTGEAWREGLVSNSMWSPPLVFPYAMMAAGMTLLCLQIATQLLDRRR